MTAKQKKKIGLGVIGTLAGIGIHLFLSYSGSMMAIGTFLERERGVYIGVANSATKQELKDTAFAIRKDVPNLFNQSNKKR